MVFLDGSVVNVVLPLIQSDLSAPLSSLQWILDAYALLLAALLLVGGALGDLYGRREVFVAGLVVFTVASVACGIAPTATVLIVARAIQGAGGALLVPGSLAMIKAVIKSEDSARAIGLWTGLSGVTAAIGPLVGGYLAGAVSWRTIFFINVPLAVAGVAMTLRFIPPNRDTEASRNLDWQGACLAVAGLGGVTYGLIEGPAKGWNTAMILGVLALGIACCMLFLLWEWRADHPMVPLGLFRSRNFSGSNAVTLGVYFCFNGALLFLVLNLQQVQGCSPLQAGLSLFPITLLLLLLSPRMGRIMNRSGARLPMTVGPLIIALAFVLFMRPGQHISYLVDVFPAVFLLGIGMSIFITPLTATVMSSVPSHSVGVASGVNNAVSRVAALLAIAILGGVVANRFDATLTTNLARVPVSAPARASLVSHRDRLADIPVPTMLPPNVRIQTRVAIHDAFLNGFRWAMGSCAVICLVCAALAAAFVRDEPVHPVM